MERLSPGHVVDGTYRIDALLSASDRAHVYAVAHLRFGQVPLVLKLVPAALYADFDRDTAALATLTTPNVAHVCDRGVLADGRPYRVVERLAGPTLREALARATFTDDRTMELVVALAATIFEARGNAIGPCDLSLDNLMFADGTGGRLCLLRALVPGASGGRAPDPEADQAALTSVRAALDAGAGALSGGHPWKPPTSIAEIRAATEQAGGPRTPPASEPGARIGRWRVVRTISEGLRATVYDVTEGDRVAVLKIAGPRAEPDELTRHARLLARIASPHVVCALDAGVHEGTPFLVMEPLRGVTEAQRLKAEGPLPIDAAIETVSDMLRGAEAIALAGGGPSDFSLEHCHHALRPDGTAHPVLTHVLGPAALHFAAYYGGGRPPPSLDTWSAAAALYELIAGRRPFPTSRQSLQRVWMGVPVPLGSRRRDVPFALSMLVGDLLASAVEMTRTQLVEALARIRAAPSPPAAAPAADRVSIEPALPQRGPTVDPAARPIPDWRIAASPSRAPITPVTAAAIAPDAGEIVAVSNDAIARYRRGRWTVDPARELGAGLRVLEPAGDGAYVAITAGGALVRLGPSGGVAPWGPTLSRYAFHGLAPDPAGGLTLVGGSTDWGRGVVARLVGESLTIVAEDIGVRTLHAVAHLADGSLLAAGAGGAIVRLRGGAVIESVQACDRDLRAIARAGDDLLVVGAGAWALRVTTAPLAVETEPVETGSGLTCLSVDEAGTAWVGSERGRILRRRERSWRRMNLAFAGDPSVLAIQATTTRLRAVLSDGQIVLGQPG